MTAEELERFENVGRGLDELVRIAWQKRAFDIAFSVLLIVIFSPAIVLILLALAADGLLVPGHLGRAAHIDATAIPFPEKYLVAGAGPFSR